MTLSQNESSVKMIGLVVLIAYLAILTAGCTDLDGHYNTSYTVVKIQTYQDGCPCSILTSNGEYFSVWSRESCMKVELNKTYRFTRYSYKVCDLDDAALIEGSP